MRKLYPTTPYIKHLDFDVRADYSTLKTFQSFVTVTPDVEIAIMNTDSDDRIEINVSIRVVPQLLDDEYELYEINCTCSCCRKIDRKNVRKCSEEVRRRIFQTIPNRLYKIAQDRIENAVGDIIPRIPDYKFTSEDENRAFIEEVLEGIESGGTILEKLDYKWFIEEGENDPDDGFRFEIYRTLHGSPEIFENQTIYRFYYSYFRPTGEFLHPDLEECAPEIWPILYMLLLGDLNTKCSLETIEGITELYFDYEEKDEDIVKMYFVHKAVSSLSLEELKSIMKLLVRNAHDEISEILNFEVHLNEDYCRFLHEIEWINEEDFYISLSMTKNHSEESRDRARPLYMKIFDHQLRKRSEKI